MLGLALVVTAFSFSPNVAPAVQRRVAPAMPSRAGGSATLHADGLAATAVQYVIALPTMYALLSAHEYMTHRWLMHLEFNRADAAVPLKRLLARAGAGKPSLPDTGHNDHHAETNDDMTIRSDASWERTAAAKALEQDAFRGTAFDWANFAIVAVTMPVYVLPTFALMGWSIPSTMSLFLPCLLLHMLVWNALHPPMHGLPRVPLAVGPPSWVLADMLLQTDYGRFIFENHQGHHVLNGKCNYNVVCPLVDHLMGTYVPPEEWAREARPVPTGASVRGAVVAPAGLPQAPTLAS